jgi:hypothetical protein
MNKLHFFPKGGFMKDVSVVEPPEPSEPKKDPLTTTLPKAAKILKEMGFDISVGKLRRMVIAGDVASFKRGVRNFVSVPALVTDFSDTSSPLWTKKDHRPQ